MLFQNAKRRKEETSVEGILVQEKKIHTETVEKKEENIEGSSENKYIITSTLPNLAVGM